MLRPNELNFYNSFGVHIAVLCTSIDSTKYGRYGVAFCFVDVKRKQKLGFKDQNIIMFCFIWIPINKLLRSVVLLFITRILIDKIDPKLIKNHYNKKNFKGTYSVNRKDIQPLTLHGITRY